MTNIYNTNLILKKKNNLLKNKWCNIGEEEGALAFDKNCLTRCSI